MNRAEYSRAYPDSFFLDPADVPGLGAYLAAGGRLREGERVLAAERAGEGNMNCVVRVRVSAGEPFILKQARPWVEKYPAIAAPRDRALVEANFYGLTAAIPAVSTRMPRLRWVDADARLLSLEDLGAARDFFSLYAGGTTLDDATLDALADYLTALHAVPLPPPAADPGDDAAGPLTNRAMRALNHTHIFDLPLRADNGLDLDAYTPGLAAAAAPLRADPAYTAVVRALGEGYLADAGAGVGALVHGDFFPGSWLRPPDGTLRVIDPEFSFRGDAAFDVGTTLAHLLLAGQHAASVDRLLARYRPAAGSDDRDMAWRLAGVEIMRRLIGVAQLPLPPDLPRKRRLLDLSRRLVLDPGRARESLELFPGG